MRRASWVALLALAATGCGGGEETFPDAPAAPSVAGTAEQAYANGHPLASVAADPVVIQREDELTALTNDYRVALGLNALVDDPMLRKLARAHSEHMILHDFFDHRNPEGHWPWDRATMVGVSWADYAENLAAGQATARQAFADLLASPQHRGVIEDPGWTHVGCGYAFDARAALVHYWTQNFKAGGGR